MSDGSGLSRETTAMYINQYIKFIYIIRCHKRLTNDYLQSLQAKILINISLIDGDLTGTWYQIYTGDGFLSSACSKKSCCVSHYNFLLSRLRLKLEF